MRRRNSILDSAAMLVIIGILAGAIGGMGIRPDVEIDLFDHLKRRSLIVRRFLQRSPACI